MIRELKLYDLIGESTPEILRLNAFFVDLFSDLTIYTKDNKPDLIFMKGNKYIMQQDLKIGVLWCRYDDFWLVLKSDFELEQSEIKEVISYKVVGMMEEAYKMGLLTPICCDNRMEEAYKMGSLTPIPMSH